MFLYFQIIELNKENDKITAVVSSFAPAKVTLVSTFTPVSRLLIAHTLIFSPVAYLSMSVAINLCHKVDEGQVVAPP